MNILFVSDIPFNPRFGGIERVTDLLAKGLLALNKGYQIFYLNFKSSNEDMLNYDFPAIRFELPEYGDLNRPSNKEYILKIISDYSIDIIVNQRGEMSMMNLVLPPNKCKIVSSIHSVVDATLYWAYYNYLNNYSKTIWGYAKHLVKYTIWPIYKKKVRHDVKLSLMSHFSQLEQASNAIVVLSPHYISQLKEYLGSSDKITAIPNPNTFPIEDIDYSHKEKNVLYVGRLDSNSKNPMRLLKIWKGIQKGHLDWNLIIVGDGSAKEEMMQYVVKHKLLNVVFEGSKQNVSDYYKKASFICLTSNFEGFGMTLTEGMTFGCIPFTFGNYGAAYDIIDDGLNGCIIPAYDTKTYAKRLSFIMDDDNKRLAMAKAAQEKVKIFSPENIVKRWDKLFQAL